MYWGRVTSLENFTEVPQEVKSSLISFIDSILEQVFNINDFSLVSITQDDKVWKSAYENKEDIKMNNEDVIKEYKKKLEKRRSYDKR